MGELRWELERLEVTPEKLGGVGTTLAETGMILAVRGNRRTEELDFG